MKISIVVPTYNEAANITALVHSLMNALHGSDYEIIVCDDNSPDLTWKIAEEMAGSYPTLRVLRRLTNRGLSASVIDGFSYATGDVVACIDADLQHDPSILPMMVSALVSGADLVVGSRYVPGGGTGEWSFIRRLESTIATKLAHWVLRIEICDPMSGYFMMRRADFMKVREQLDGHGFKILLEIAAHLKPSKVAEIPYTFRTRTAGESKLSSKVVYQYLVQLWKLSTWSKLISAEFLKFAIVGSLGVLVNLGAMIAFLAVTPYRDWRASTFATLIATFSNYVINNFWTFRQRAHTGRKFFGRYLFHLVVSLIGIGITTGVFVAGTWLARRLTGDTTLPMLVLLGCQFLAIAIGALFNYEVSRKFTWRKQGLFKSCDAVPAVGNHSELPALMKDRG